MKLLERGLVLAAVVALVGRAWHHMALLGDGFWSIATGRWILLHSQLPTSDPFAFGSTGDWRPISTGACVVFAFVTHRIGLRGLMAFATAVEALAVALVWARSTRTPIVRAALLPLALFYIEVDSQDLSARGQIFGDLALVLLFGVLARLRDGKRVHPVLIVLLAAVWTNLHLSFLAAIALPLVAAVIAYVDEEHRPRARSFLIASGLGLVGACLNPYGPKYFDVALHTALDTSTVSIDLFTSPDFHEPLWLVAPALALVIAISPGRFVDRAFLLVILAAACKSRRFATALVAVEIGLLGPLLEERWKSRRQDAIAIATGAGALAVGIWSLVSEGWSRKDPLHDVPAAATTLAAAQHGNVIAPLHWGGYLAYAWMGSPRYFIDGRDHVELFGNGAFDDYLSMWRGSADALALLDDYQGNVILWERGRPLDVMLRRDRTWRLAYESAMAVVYVREQRPR